MAAPLESLAPIETALQARPFALLCDVDGTLSPLAPTPDAAEVTPHNLELLARLSRLVQVAVVSGRDLPDLDRMLGLPDLTYIGLHGLAWRSRGAGTLVPEAQPFRRLTGEAARELAHVKRIPGVVLEVKSCGLALHYRGAARGAAARAEIMRAIASSRAAGAFEVREGIRVVELRPPVGVTKGYAVRRLVDQRDLKGLLYLGDDLTDVDAFEAVRGLREAGRAAAYAIAVQHEETPAPVIAAADLTLQEVEGVEWLLARLVERFSAAGPPAPDAPARSEDRASATHNR